MPVFICILAVLYELTPSLTKFGQAPYEHRHLHPDHNTFLYAHEVQWDVEFERFRPFPQFLDAFYTFYKLPSDTLERSDDAPPSFKTSTTTFVLHHNDHLI